MTAKQNDVKDKKETGLGCFWLILSPLLILGVGALAYSFYLMGTKIYTISWEPVEAQVHFSQLKEKESTTGKRSTTVSQVFTSYHYVVNQKSYHSDRIAYGYGYNTIDEHASYYYELYTAETVTAYYNPDNPSQAVLMRDLGVDFIAFFLFGITMLSLVFTILSPFYLIKKFPGINPNFDRFL